jgi:hypothetical protein
MEEFVAFVAWLVIEVILIQTGRAVIAIATFGRWRGEAISGNEGGIHAPAGALSFVRDGRRVVTANGMLFVGVAFYILVVFALVSYVG